MKSRKAHSVTCTRHIKPYYTWLTEQVDSQPATEPQRQCVQCVEGSSSIRMIKLKGILFWWSTLGRDKDGMSGKGRDRDQDRA